MTTHFHIVKLDKKELLQMQKKVQNISTIREISEPVPSQKQLPSLNGEGSIFFELSKNATTKDFSAVQNREERQVRRNVIFYNLDAIISVTV